MYPAIPADCGPHQIGPYNPVGQELTKSGGADSDFARSFLLGGPDIHLPVGTWDITAITGFWDTLCDQHGHEYSLGAGVRITVSEGGPPPTPTATPSVPPTPSPPTAEELSTLATGSWVRRSDTTGSWSFDFGRLDGRAFHFQPPRFGNVSRPANDGHFVAWWGDPASNDTIVELVDTATGSMHELAHVPIGIYAAAISPLGDAWYWVPEVEGVGCGGEPCRPDANGLWRQTLPGGKPEKVADWNGWATAVSPSTDGSQILVVDPEPATDTGPVHYHVWYADTGNLFDLPVTEDIAFGLFNGRVLLHRYEGYLAGLDAVDPRTGEF